MAVVTKKPRRVLVQMSSNRHIECVELTADIWNPEPQEFFGDLAEIENMARERLRLNEPLGPWQEPESNYIFVTAFIAILQGMEAGRITSVKQVAFKTKKTAIFEREKCDA